MEAEKNRKLESSVNNKTSVVDRFYDLDEPIIHDVLSLLPTKDVTKFSILSRRWNFIWRSFPIIDFDETLFVKSLSTSGRAEEFLNFVHDSIMRREQKISIQKFRLRISLNVEQYYRVDSTMRFAIEFAIKNNVKELDINILSCEVGEELYYRLPWTTFSANSITVLKLKGFDLEIQDQMLSCPLIEDLSLTCCDVSENIKVSGAKLKIMELDCCRALKRIEIDAPNLQSFICNGSMPCTINVAVCRFLKNLTIKGAMITDEWFGDQVSKFSLLENLELDGCIKLERIKISHEQLKSFHLLRCEKLVAVEIDTPKLISFMYTGEIISVDQLNSSGLLNATLSLNSNNGTIEWFRRMRDFLKFFGHCKVLTLVCSSDKDLIFPEELRGLLRPLYDLKHLKIEISLLSTSFKELVDGLLWLSPRPETLSLSVLSDSREKLIKFHYGKIVAKEEDPFCCRGDPIKCWRHYLKEVTMENFEGIDDKECLLKYFSKNAKMLETIHDNSKTLE